MNKKKLFVSILTSVLLCLNLTTQVSASNLPNEEIEIRINDIVLETSDYESFDTYIERIINGNSESIVLIKEKNTNKILEKITEYKVPLSSSSLRKSDVTMSSSDTFYYLLRRHRYDGPITTTLEVPLIMYSSGSFRSIQAIETPKIFASSIGVTTLEDKSAYARSQTGSFPTTSIIYGGSGVITGTTNVSIGGGFSVDALKAANFSVSVSGNFYIYYRKTVGLTGSYRCY